MAQAQLWPQLPLEIEDRILSLIPCNEIACTLRLVNRAAASRFGGPKCVRVWLSQPVPHHAFKHHCQSGAARFLSYTNRVRLVCLTAASGDLPNLEVAEAAAGCTLTGAEMEAAAAAGHLHACMWLRERGGPWGSALTAAARSGHGHLCNWMLAEGCPLGIDAVAAAARGGHLDLMEGLRLRWQALLQTHGGGDSTAIDEATSVLAAVVEGCNLGAVQQVFGAFLTQQDQREEAGGEEPVAAADRPHPPAWQEPQQEPQVQLPDEEDPCGQLLAAAAGSPTSDWSAKVEWIESVLGCPRSPRACEAAAATAPSTHPDALERLAWLRSRGYPWTERAVSAAARAGNTLALEYLLAEGCPCCQAAAQWAAEEGHLEALRLLYVFGCGLDPLELFLRAVERGHLQVVAWLAAEMGVDRYHNIWGPVALHVTSAAARSGSLEVLGWLQERGYRWGGVQLAAAAEGGCEAALEWLLAHGCPMQDDGQPYASAARHGDLATLRCLRRLGCPWGPFDHLLQSICDSAPLPALRWLVAEGCPADAGGRVVASLPPLLRSSRSVLSEEVARWLHDEGQRRRSLQVQRRRQLRRCALQKLFGCFMCEPISAV